MPAGWPARSPAVRTPRPGTRADRAGTAAKALDLVALRQAHACQFTAGEIGAFLDSTELSDFELELVAWGCLEMCRQYRCGYWRMSSLSNLHVSRSAQRPRTLLSALAR